MNGVIPEARATAPKDTKAAKAGEPNPTDLVFSKTHRELFNTILAEENLRTDREGLPRTAYNLRHTYICLRLLEGADIYQIAKNCRISVEMIEKYYASHIKATLDAAAINIMRPQKKDQGEDQRPRPRRRGLTRRLPLPLQPLPPKTYTSRASSALTNAGVAEWQTQRT